MNRKISEQVIADFGIYSKEDGTIVIPVKDEQDIFIFNKYRRNPFILDSKAPKYTYDVGGKVTLFAYNKAKDSDTILITEGEFDCLVAWSHNIQAITSTGGAMSFQEEWALLLKDKEVIVCFDNDQAGGDGMVKVLKYIPHAKILFLPDRAGVKDISDYVSSGGDLHSLIRTAKHFNSMEEVLEDRAERLSLWKSTFFHDSYIKENSKIKKEYKPDENITDDIARAKQYPIENLLDFKHKKTKCLWHNDSNPSLTLFKDTNTCYCFACNKVADSIEVVRKQMNVSFKDAVKWLNNN